MSTGRPPRTPTEWVRDIAQRVRALEQSRTAHIGPWTIIDRDGSLLAIKPGSTPVHLESTDGTTALQNWTDLLTGLSQGDIGALITFLNASKANSDAALDNWATTMDTLLGTGHAIGDMVDWWQSVSDSAGTSSTNWTDLLTGLSQGNATALADYLAASKAASDEALANWAVSMDALLGSGVTTIEDLVAWWQSLWSTADTAGTDAAAAKAAADEALANWAASMDGLLGSGVTTIEDLVAWWLAQSDTANQAQQNWIDLLTGLAQGNPTALADYLAATRAAADEAADNWAASMDGLLGSGVTTIEDLVNWWQGLGTAADDSATKWNDFLSGMGVPDIPGVTSWLFATESTANAAAADASSAQTTAGTANTNATAALGNWTTAINGLLGGTTHTLADFIADLSGTKSTAGTANSNASTALTNAASAQSTANTASTNASTALGNWTTAINGLLGGTTHTLTDFIADLTGTRSTASTASSNASTALTNASDALSAAGDAVTTAEEAQATANAAYGPDSAIPAPQIFGMLLPSQVGVITAGAVQATDQNLLVSQYFLTADSVVGDDHWSWDGTVGDLNLGSAKATADGTETILVSSEAAVTEGETILARVRVLYTSLSYTGSNPICFGVEKFRKVVNGDQEMYVDIGGEDLAMIGSPPASSGGFVTLATSTDYTVPSGVDQVRMRFRIPANLTSGSVNFDNAQLIKTQKIADESVPGVGLTLDSIVQALFGWLGDGYTHDQAYAALDANAQTVLDLSSRVAQLEAQGGAGSVAGDDFGWLGHIESNANWNCRYGGLLAGYYEGTGSLIQYVPIWPTLAFTNEMGFRWEGPDATSTTDYQTVQIVLATSPTWYPFVPAAVDVLGRISDDWQSYVIFRVDASANWYLYRVVAGTPTQMTTGTCNVPGVGGIITVNFGDKTAVALRNFKAWISNTLVCDYDEAGTASQVGASNRKYGWGAIAYWAMPTIFAVFPPSLNQWIGMDQ